MEHYYQPEIECAPRDQIRAWQSERLAKTVKHVYEHVEYYRKKMDEKGVKPEDIQSVDDLHKLPFITKDDLREAYPKPEDIQSVDDLHKLPFITKDDLREAYPYGLLAKPLSDCVRIQSTSGTTGRRVVAFYTQHDIDLWEDCCARAIAAAGGTREDVVHVSYGYGLFTGTGRRVVAFYTQHDIDLWEDCCARAIAAAGGTREDVVHVSYGYGLFTGGAGLHGGSHKIGSLTLPMSSGNTDRQIQFMCDLESTILCCTPSYAAYLAESICERGLQNKIKLKAGIFGAEAWTEEMRRDIEKKLGIKAYDIYGLTEISGPGVSFECSAQSGMHVNEDHFIAEVINPKTGEVLPDGEKGELVFTCITKEAFPLIRYRTRDICILSHEPCSCGRTHVKMTKPLGRSDDMLIVKGVNVFPSQIETVLINQGYPANYQIVVDRVDNSDTIEVQVEMTPEMFSDNVGVVASREKELVNALKSMLGIAVKVRLVNPKSIARSEGKAVRVVDKRNLYKN